MTNFYDIQFLHWGHSEKTCQWIDKHFDYYVLDYAHKGTLEYALETAPVSTLTGPVAWLTFPGPRFQFGKRETDTETWEHYYVAFRGTYAKELMGKGVFDVDTPVISIYDSAQFQYSFDTLLNYLETPKLGNDRSALMLTDLLLQFHEQKLYQCYEQMDARIKQVIGKVEKHPEGEWDFRTEARKLGLSYSHFRKLFHDGIHTTPTHFVIAQRMKLAMKLLKEPGLCLTEAANRTGYSDICYFSKLFKKHHGMSPGKYRKQAALHV